MDGMRVKSVDGMRVEMGTGWRPESSLDSRDS